MYKDSLWSQPYNNSNTSMPGGRGLNNTSNSSMGMIGGLGSMGGMMNMGGNGIGLGGMGGMGGMGSVGAAAPQPCKYFMSGGCLKGDSCPFSHEIPDERHLDIDGLGFVFNTNVVVHNPRAQQPSPATQANLSSQTQMQALPSLSGSVSAGIQPQQSPVQPYPLSATNNISSNNGTPSTLTGNTNNAFTHLGAGNVGGATASSIRTNNNMGGNLGASPTTGGAAVMSPTALSFNIAGLTGGNVSTNNSNTLQQQNSGVQQQQQQMAANMLHHRNSSNSTPLSGMTNGVVNSSIAALLGPGGNGDGVGNSINSIHSSPAPSMINGNTNNNNKVLMPAVATNMNALQSLANNSHPNSGVHHSSFLSQQSPTTGGPFSNNQQLGSGFATGGPQRQGHPTQNTMPLPATASIAPGRGKRLAKYRPCDPTFPHNLPPFLQGAFENMNNANNSAGGQQAATLKTLHDLFRIPLPIDAPYPHIISVAVNSPSGPNSLNVANVSSNAAAAAAASNNNRNNNSTNNNNNNGSGWVAGGGPPLSHMVGISNQTNQRPIVSPFAFPGEYGQQGNKNQFVQQQQNANNNNNTFNNNNNNNPIQNASSSSHSGHSTPAPAPMSSNAQQGSFNNSSAQPVTYQSGTNPFVK